MIRLKEISVRGKNKNKKTEGERNTHYCWPLPGGGGGGEAIPNLQTPTAALHLQSQCSGLEMEAALGGAS